MSDQLDYRVLGLIALLLQCGCPELALDEALDVLGRVPMATTAAGLMNDMHRVIRELPHA